jgi:predicted PurR-regulated permease PerM
VAIHGVSGNVLTPWLASRANRLSAVSVFVGVLAFGWLWGIWGLLLGVPILTTVKAVCDRVEDLQPIGELLGH